MDKPPTSKSPQAPGAILHLAAAASFGLSATLAQRLLTSSSPLVLAGRLYHGNTISATESATP